MGKAGGIIGIIAGVFGFIAAIVTLFVGGLGSAFEAEGAKTVVGFGWGGVLFSFLAIVFGAVAVARPKGAGIGLIIVSILGAILGGTLVAVCMVLSLIGGILALVGAKDVQPTANAVTEASQSSGIASKKKTSVWLWVGASAGVVVIGLAMIAGQNRGKPKEDPLAELASAQPSTLRAEGELSELFALGSKNTDLQRENKLKEIQGQVVQWQLPVYEVSRSGDGYKVQTKTGIKVGPFGQDLVGTFIYITPRDDAERRAIEALKTGDVILVKGRIAGSWLRSLELKPAILVTQASPQPQAQPISTQQVQPQSQVSPLASKPTEQPITAPTSVAEPTPATAIVPSARQPQLSPQATRGPSFDCAKASTFAEKAICSDPLLGKLDGALSDNYKHMLASDIGEGATNDLKTTQKSGLQSATSAQTTNALLTPIGGVWMRSATILLSQGCIRFAHTPVTLNKPNSRSMGLLAAPKLKR